MNVFLVEYTTGLLQRQLVREILKKALVYVPAFEPSVLINISQIADLCFM